MSRTLHTAEQQALTRVLRQLREKAGLRQVELAERLQRPQSFVSKYETGERRLDLVELRLIAHALDLNLLRVVQLFEKELN